MKYVWELLVICASFMASPAIAQASCIPKELRDSLEASKKAGFDNLTGAKEEFSKAKAAADRLVVGPKKEEANRTASAASKKSADAAIRVAAQSEMVDPLLRLTLCAQHLGHPTDTAPAANPTAQPFNATAQTQATYTAEFADLRNTVKWNQHLLIFLIFLFIAAIILLYILSGTLGKSIDSSLYKCAKGVKEATKTQIDRIQELLAVIPYRAAESMQPTAGKGAPEQPPTPPPSAVSGALMPQQAHHQGGQTDMPPSPGSLISDGNTQPCVAAKATTLPALLPNEEDFDSQFNEAEIWPIVLPMAALIVVTDKNLTTDILTQTFMRTVESSRPGLARKMRKIGFQSISGRVAPDGRETTRDPEMFAVELSGLTLLFTNPRGKYKQSLDTYFEGANMHNWKNCLRAAVVEKTGDNLLTVIERGNCGG